MELENYELNLKCSLEKLNQYGLINGGGVYSIEYAEGNYIYFSPYDGRFLRLGGWCSFSGIDYKSLLEEKIKVLKIARVIKRKEK